MMPSRHRVRQAFGKAASTYDSAATAQRHACHRLAECLPGNQPLRRVLDVGCGTGYGLRLLEHRLPQALCVGIDFAPSMLTRTSPSLALAGDAERLPVQAGSIDLYWSSLCWQWCDLPTVLSEAARVLAGDGVLCASTLGPHTFHELRFAFAAGDRYSHTLNFLAPDKIRHHAAEAGLSEIHLMRESLVTRHEDFRTLMRSVKAIGANQHGHNRRRGLMGRAALARAEAAYEALRQPGGLPLTYDLIYLVARK